MRAALSFGVVLLWIATAAGLQAGSVTVEKDGWQARFEGPTFRYGHGIMGDLAEWGRLCLTGPGQRACVELPQTSVFEDIAPRLHDVDGDGAMEAVVVESTFSAGAALVVYRLRDGVLQRIATPHIGTRNRWLAPIAIVDLDGDGAVELAYIDRPHLAKRMRVWRYQSGRLIHVADLGGLTNHKIGETFITGGVRDCGAGYEMITADAAWRSVMATRLSAGVLTTEPIAGFSAKAVRDALLCR